MKSFWELSGRSAVKGKHTSCEGLILILSAGRGDVVVSTTGDAVEERSGDLTLVLSLLNLEKLTLLVQMNRIDKCYAVLGSNLRTLRAAARTTTCGARTRPPPMVAKVQSQHVRSVRRIFS